MKRSIKTLKEGDVRGKGEDRLLLARAVVAARGRAAIPPPFDFAQGFGRLRSASTEPAASGRDDTKALSIILQLRPKWSTGLS